jgi:hypothetical protein
MTAGLEHAEDLPEGAFLIGDKIQHAVADDDIDAVSRHRKVFNLAEAELHIGVAQALVVPERFGNHVLREIHADHPSCFANLAAGDEDVVTGA